MRETKYTAWDKNIETMVDPENLHLDGSGLVAVYYQNCDDVESVWETDPLILENITLLQYTGLKDKNGKEIYEGNITCRHWGDGSWQNGQIIYEEGCFRWQEINKDRFIHPIGINTLHSEVIGNIYENKELLT